MITITLPIGYLRFTNDACTASLTIERDGKCICAVVLEPHPWRILVANVAPEHQRQGVFSCYALPFLEEQLGEIISSGDASPALRGAMCKAGARLVYGR